MIGRHPQPRTSLLIVRNEDGTPEKVRVTGKSARHEARMVKAAIQHHGDRVVSVHDSSGKALYSQGAWPESPAGDVGGRTATEPRHRSAPATPAVTHAMDRETDTRRDVAKSAAVVLSMAGHDAFATGHGYETVADPEDSAVRLQGFRHGGSGVVIGRDQVLTAEHVANNWGMPATVVSDPERDLAVVEQDAGDTPALALATQAPAIGQEVTILSSRVGGTKPAHVIGTGEQVKLDVGVPDGTSGAPVVDAQGQIVSTITHGDDEAGTCRGPSAPAIREAIAVPDPERAAGQPLTGPQIPLDDAALTAGHQPAISR